MKEWGLNCRLTPAVPNLTVAQYDALMDYWEESEKTFDTDEAVLEEKAIKAFEALAAGLEDCRRKAS